MSLASQPLPPSRLDVVRAVLVQALAAVPDRELNALYSAHQSRLRYDELAQSSGLSLALRAALQEPPTRSAMLSILDQSIDLIRQIPNLCALLERPELSHSATNRGLVDAWSYGLLLERVSAVCVQSPACMATVQKHLDVQRKHRSWYRHNRYFLSLKVLSVVPPMRHMNGVASGRSRPMRWVMLALLALNLVEGIATDWASGNRVNARRGVRLLLRPLRRVWRQGALCRFGFDDSKQWADDYTEWNLRFMSRFPAFLKVAIVLLIPSALAYVDAPDSFMHRRTFVLFQHLHFAVFGYADGVRLDQEPGASKAIRDAFHGRAVGAVRGGVD